ncbi:MAG: hypothetical protein IJ566_03080 [Cardiobacteriaceae bacterium]|nr:hypothetical protein [Cardiobacteriaceae bacterium]
MKKKKKNGHFGTKINNPTVKKSLQYCDYLTNSGLIILQPTVAKNNQFD